MGPVECLVLGHAWRPTSHRGSESAASSSRGAFSGLTAGALGDGAFSSPSALSVRFGHLDGCVQAT
jgi:hypothetical protein